MESKQTSSLSKSKQPNFVSNKTVLVDPLLSTTTMIMNGTSRNHFNNDDAFQSLLNSQRLLLSRINKERMEEEDQRTKADGPSRKKPRRVEGSLATSTSLSRSLGVDPMFLMNTSITPQHFDRIGSQDLSQPRFFSASDFGGGFRASFPYNAEGAGSGRFGGAKDVDLSYFMSMKRRGSIFGGFSSDEPVALATRRFSMLSTFSGLSGLGGIMADDSEDANQGGDCDLDNLEPMPLVPAESQSVVKLDPTIPLDNVQQNLRSFVSSMEKSTKTQQDIHDWDKKMGLKRSHSKTMRMSMRSRKKLRTMLKKDISLVLQQKRNEGEEER